MKNANGLPIVAHPSFRAAVPALSGYFVSAVVAACLAFKFRDIQISFYLFLFIVFVIVLAMIGTSAKCLLAAMFNTYTFAQDQVSVKTGVLNTKTVSVKVADIRGVAISRPFFGRILGYASASIGTAATAGAEIHVENVRDLDSIVAKLDQARKG